MLLSVLWKYVCLTTDIMWLMFMRAISIGPNCSDGKQWLSNSFSEGNIVCINLQSLSLTYCLPPFSPLTPFLQMNYPITPMGNSGLRLASCETSNWIHICQFPKDMFFCNLLEWIICGILFPPSFLIQFYFFLLHLFEPTHLFPKLLPILPPD